MENQQTWGCVGTHVSYIGGVGVGVEGVAGRDVIVHKGMQIAHTKGNAIVPAKAG